MNIQTIASIEGLTSLGVLLIIALISFLGILSFLMPYFVYRIAKHTKRAADTLNEIRIHQKMQGKM